MVNSFFVTFTPYDSLTFEDIIEFLKSIGIQTYFICYEEASRPHYHFVIETNRSVENFRYLCKTRLNGRLHISGKDIEDKVQAIAYCMKDGVYRENNMNVNDILLAKQRSHPKIKFDDELKVLMEDEESSIPIIAKKLIDLHIKCKRKIYRQHLKAIMDTIRARRCHIYRQELEKYIIDDY